MERYYRMKKAILNASPSVSSFFLPSFTKKNVRIKHYIYIHRTKMLCNNKSKNINISKYQRVSISSVVKEIDVLNVNKKGLIIITKKYDF